MAQPYNYSMNVPNPASNIMSGVMQGVQLASGINKIKEQQAMKAYSEDMAGIYGEGVDKQAFAQQMVEKYPQFAQNTMKSLTVMDQQEQAKLMQTDLAGLANNSNATAEDFSKMMIKYPQLSEQFKRSFDVLNQSKKDSAVKEASSIYGAINSGNVNLAKQILNTKIQAAENANLPEEANTLKALVQQIDISPESAKTTAGLFLASSVGADKFPEMFKQLNEGSTMYRVLTPGEKSQLGLPTDTAFQISPKGQITQVGSKGVNVTVEGSPQFGTIPQGFQLVKDGNTYKMEAIPGSPAEAAAKKIAETKKKAALETQQTGGIVFEDLGRLKKKVENAPWYNPVTGITGAIASYIPGTNRVDAEQLKETIVANIGFDKLQRMREASPTGGALGGISAPELSNLQSVLGNLALSQSDEQLIENLDRLNKVYGDILKKANAYPNAAEFGFGTSEEDKKSIFEKYGIKE